MQKNSSYKPWLLVLMLLWMCLIFFMSHQPKDESVKYSHIAIWILQSLHIDLNDWSMGNASFIVRKAAHITEYFLLTFMALRIKEDLPQLYLKAALFCVFYAATDEFHQTFIAGRVGTINDIFVDGIGVTLACLQYYYVRKR